MNRVKEIILAGQNQNYVLIVPKSFYTKSLMDKDEDIISSIMEIRGENVTIWNGRNTLFKFTLTFTELENYIRNETFVLTLKIRL